jgi:hypothetical protein
VRDDEIQVSSPLLLLDDLEHYRARGRSFRKLREEDAGLADRLLEQATPGTARA